MAIILKQSMRAFREYYDWIFKASKYNQNKAVSNVIANDVHTEIAPVDFQKQYLEYQLL